MIIRVKNKEEAKELIKEMNKNVISKEFLHECKEVMKLFEPVDSEHDRNKKKRGIAYGKETIYKI